MSLRPKIVKLARMIGGLPGMMNKIDENAPEYYALECVVTDEMADVAVCAGLRKPRTMQYLADKCGKSLEETTRLAHQLADTGVFTIWKNRIPWLLILMLAASITGWIIMAFENTLLLSTALIAYIPMLMDAGGNAGIQTNVSVVRSLSIQELEFEDLFRVMWKEFRVSILCGVTLAVVNFAKLMLLDQVGMAISLAVSLALVCTVIVAKFLGCLFPMAAKKLGLDPALASSPVVTTLADILSLVIYFLIAGAML